jgi:DNA-binding response OmpR family regulator
MIRLSKNMVKERKMKVLLLEDDVILSELICEFLESLSYEVKTVFSGYEAEDCLYENKFDLLLLDVNVPDIDGFTVLKNMRKISDKTPAIFITSKNTTKDIKAGFEAGCDDYIKKPFELDELELRINNIKRLYSIESDKIEVIQDDISYNYAQCSLRKDGEMVRLPKKESKILEFLIQNRGRVVSSEEITVNVWGYDNMPTDSTIRTYIKNLRSSVGEKIIKNIKGIGYILNTA